MIGRFGQLWSMGSAGRNQFVHEMGLGLDVASMGIQQMMGDAFEANQGTTWLGKKSIIATRKLADFTSRISGLEAQAQYGKINGALEGLVTLGKMLDPDVTAKDADLNLVFRDSNLKDYEINVFRNMKKGVKGSVSDQVFDGGSMLNIPWNLSTSHH